VREHENEPVLGLPERLPGGEEILWQGSPKWTGMAVRALHARAVAIYFVLLGAWLAGVQLVDGAPLSAAAEAAARVVPGAAIALALLAAIAFFVSRATIYTITSRRVVMRFGVALPMTLNIPFAQIGSADVRVYRDGSGDIPLALSGAKRQSMAVLWPHVRPWHTVEPEPMLRCLPDARRVAETLAAALRTAHADSPKLAAAPMASPRVAQQRIHETAAA
jgi:hypothetical protein